MFTHLQADILAGAGILLILVTAPLLLELLLVSVAAALPTRRGGKGEAKFAAVKRMIVLVPSHDEEISIAACVRSIGASAGGMKDILVVAHNCLDGTADRAREAGAQVYVLDDPSLRGKGHALVQGFEQAFRSYGADAVLIVDADARLSNDFVATVRESLRYSPVVQSRYEASSAQDTAKARLRALSFLCMNVVRPKGRSRLGLSCGIVGNGFALRKEVLDRVPYSSHSIIEDVEFHLSLLASGIRTSFVADALVSADVPANTQAMTTQSSRWEGGRIRMMLSRGPFVLGQIVRGKTQLIEPFLDLAGLPLAIEVIALLLILLFPMPAYRWYALCGLMTIVFHLCVAIGQSRDPRGDIRALFHAPFYLISKVAMLPSIVGAARRTAVWVRTSRVPDPQSDK